MYRYVAQYHDLEGSTQVDPSRIKSYPINDFMQSVAGRNMAGAAWNLIREKNEQGAAAMQRNEIIRNMSVETGIPEVHLHSAVPYGDTSKHCPADACESRGGGGLCAAPTRLAGTGGKRADAFGAAGANEGCAAPPRTTKCADGRLSAAAQCAESSHAVHSNDARRAATSAPREHGRQPGSRGRPSCLERSAAGTANASG